MKFLNDENKKIFWWNKNYYFIGTIFIVVFNILKHASMKGESVDSSFVYERWSEVLSFTELKRAFSNSFSHSNWQHVLLNMFCFLGCGLYLERKTGSFGMILLVFAFAFITSTAITANYLSNYWHGFSGVNYGLYAFILVDYLFSFQKMKKNKYNIKFGAIILSLIYFAMCFNGGTSSISFELNLYPYDLIHNLGHYSSAIAGLVIGLLVQISQLKTLKETKNTEE